MLSGLRLCSSTPSTPTLYLDGATWYDPNRVDEWVGKLNKNKPVVTFCVYGFHVGCRWAIALRDAGFDAMDMKGGHSAWMRAPLVRPAARVDRPYHVVYIRSMTIGCRSMRANFNGCSERCASSPQ